MRLKVSHHHMQPGLLVAVKRQQAWYRGKIVKSIGADKARVFLVDLGITEDVFHDDRVRYLREDFSCMPAIAHRGILSYVRPKNDRWSNESINFMRKRCNQRFEAKIQRIDEASQSYFTSMKKDGDLPLSDSLIRMGACTIDLSFWEPDGFACVDDFSYFENGLHLDAAENDDDWLPKTPAKSSNANSRLPMQAPRKPSESGPSTDATPAPMPTGPTRKMKCWLPDKRKRVEVPPRSSLINNRLQPLKVPPISRNGSVASAPLSSIECMPCVQVVQPLPIQIETPASPDQKEKDPEKTQTDPGLLPPKVRPLGEQNLSKFHVGMKTVVLIHEVNEPGDFYFFLRDELLQHLEFQEIFK